MSDFQWGALACDRLRVGLRLVRDELALGEPIEYEISIANHSDRRRELILFADLDATSRTAIRVQHVGTPAIVSDAAIRFAIVTCSGLYDSVVLEPGEEHRRIGWPLVLRPEFIGDNVVMIALQARHDGTPCSIESARVTLRLRSDVSDV
jgi:hypothetical protein